MVLSAPFLQSLVRGDRAQRGTTNEIKPFKTYGLAFVFALVMSYNLAFFLGDDQTTAAWGAAAGFLAGFGWSALSFAIIALFEQRSWKYIFINGGYMTVYFTLIGFILGVWR